MTCPQCDTPLDSRCPECGARPEPTKSELFDKDYLIVGEGGADSEFFRYLTKSRGLDNFQSTSAAGGKSKFWQRLRAIRANRRFDDLSGVVLVRDSNGNPNSALKDVQEQIRNVGDYPI